MLKVRVKRWVIKRKVVWAEPALPKFVKINPGSPPGAAEGLQPGEITMARAVEEFLESTDEEMA